MSGDGSPSAGRVLISGSRGRIGSFLVRELRGLGEKVVPFSRTPERDYMPFEDLLEPSVLAGAKTVIHSAWSTVPLVAEEARGREWRVDIPFLVGLLNEMSHLPGPERPHLIFLSTASVYGPLDKVRCDESMEPTPGGWYAFGKLAAEGLIREFSRRHEVRATILRISNVFGFSSRGTVPQGVIPRMLHVARAGGCLRLWGDGTARKDYLHCDDLLSAIGAVITSPAIGTFNLSVGRSHSLHEVIEMAARVMGQRIPWEPGDKPGWDASQDFIANDSFCRTFSWTPEVDLEAGLNRLRDQLKP